MAIVTAFSADVVSGDSPLTVNFANLSTGSPDYFLWDFGDGTFSQEENPTHIYEGNNGDKFTVKLNAWINSGQVTISMPDISPSVETKDFSGAEFESNESVFSTFLGMAWTPDQALPLRSYCALTRDVTDTYRYLASRTTHEVVMPSGPSDGGPSVYLIEGRSRVTYDNFEGTVISDLGGDISAPIPFFEWQAFLDVSDRINTTFNILFDPVLELKTDPGEGNSTGFASDFILYEYTTASSDNYDDETKTDYITIGGDPPIAEFSAAPTTGPSPLTVALTNLSTPASEGETTYSWKKRLSGSGDAFVEFSTDENPSHDFTK